MNERDRKVEVYDVNEDDLLNKFGLDRSQIDDYQVLCLPENFREAGSKEDLCDTDDAIALCKQLRNAGLKSANSYDLNIHEKYYIRKSAVDVWLATLWLLSPLVWDLVKDIIEDFIGDSIYGRIKGKMQQEDSPSTDPSISPNAHLNLILRKGDELRILEYKGDSAAMTSSLDKIVKEFFSTHK
ncbi:MAG: hypothetical protein WCG09_03255 [Halobacteriota archaeon]